MYRGLLLSLSFTLPIKESKASGFSGILRGKNIKLDSFTATSKTRKTYKNEDLQ